MHINHPIHRCVSYESYRIDELYILYDTLTCGFKMSFLLKFVILFDLNKLLDFVNTKLLGNLIESNEIASP